MQGLLVAMNCKSSGIQAGQAGLLNDGVGFILVLVARCIGSWAIDVCMGLCAASPACECT